MDLNLVEARDFIRQELPYVLQTDKTFRYIIQDMLRESFADKQKTEDRFEKMLSELRALREESQRKWDEQQTEQNQAEIRALREESERKWDEHRTEMRDLHKSLIRKHDSTIGALGARWGLHAEGSFRNALKSILEESFGVQVLNVTEFDHEGKVFGEPDQVELDIIIKNGLLIICEIKSSISKSDMHTFWRKVKFYEKLHDTKANRQIVVSPMVNKYAHPVAKRLGIEVYSHAEDIS
ncbi:MAG: hypothetical protein B6242_07245 [Anaerolineaceae bacterium 4572_78]|nr:MAG: hypothetical protein B6242_07245 [Anaerolineaceae bacterium 4572_78]